MNPTRLLTLLCLATLAHAAPVTLAWDHDEGAASYEVFRGIDKLATVTDKQSVVDVSVGDMLHVVAVNSLGHRSPQSEPLTILPEHFPPLAPTKLRVVVIETSSNLTDWEPLAYVPLHTDQSARFVRAGISVITP